jgi:site-specific recombinase XerD
VTRSSAAALLAPTLESLAPSWDLSLRAGNKSPRTVQTYLESLRSLDRHLTEAGMPRVVSSIRREHVESWIAALLERSKPATASNRYRAAVTFFRRCIEEGELTASPMERMSPPKVPENPPPLITEEQIAALLKDCAGTEFVDRRDTAIIRILLDTGMRRAELAGLCLNDVDLRTRELRVTGKGDRVRIVRMGFKTASAVDRYLRARARHRHRFSDRVFVGQAGALDGNAVAHMLTRRCERAGIPKINPHAFRHRHAHDWLAAGGGEADLMSNHGWRSHAMVTRYAASAAAERARHSEGTAVLPTVGLIEKPSP